MTSMVKRMVLAAFVGSVLVGWGVYAGGESVQAQAKPTAKPSIRMTRLYTGPGGVSFLEDMDAKTVPTATGEETALMAVPGVQFARIATGTFFDWHPEPQRQYVIILKGQLELEVGGGTRKKQVFRAGDIIFAEDITGQGHTSRMIGPEDAVAIIVPLGPAK
jgi:quercetin dioxygenase-like cupin family protein